MQDYDPLRIQVCLRLYNTKNGSPSKAPPKNQIKQDGEPLRIQTAIWLYKSKYIAAQHLLTTHKASGSEPHDKT